MDFLTFKSFISSETLIILYYVGVVTMPGSVWYIFTRIIKNYNNFGGEKINKYIDVAFINGKKIAWKSLNKKQKIKFITLLAFLFFIMQLLWRIMFEFLIAYMQMHDALQNLQS